MDGLRILEGDILLTENQWRSLLERKGHADTTRRWPEGPDGYPLVPYIITDGKQEESRIRVLESQYISSKCVYVFHTRLA